MPAVSTETLDFLVKIAKAGSADRFDRHLVTCGDAYRPQMSEHIVRYVVRAAERGRSVPSQHGFRLEGARPVSVSERAPTSPRWSSTGWPFPAAEPYSGQHKAKGKLCLTGKSPVVG